MQYSGRKLSWKNVRGSQVAMTTHILHSMQLQPIACLQTLPVTTPLSGEDYGALGATVFSKTQRPIAIRKQVDVLPSKTRHCVSQTTVNQLLYIQCIVIVRI